MQAQAIRVSFLNFSKDIKLSHSIFALPFALVGLLMSDADLPGFWQGFLLLSCMISARSFAMGMNRYLDRRIDSINPRTTGRMIPAGYMRSWENLVWSGLFSCIFVGCSFALNDTAGYLSPFLLLFLAGYSYMKMLTSFCHLYLGACLGLAPIAVAIALDAPLTMQLVCLGAAVMCWAAGFDILYSLQDFDFDRQNGLKSVPVLLGLKGAVWCSRILFLAMIILLIFSGWFSHAGWAYYAGCFVVSCILIYEHWLVRHAVHGDLSRIDVAFFTANGWVSVLFYAFCQFDYIF